MQKRKNDGHIEKYKYHQLKPRVDREDSVLRGKILRTVPRPPGLKGTSYNRVERKCKLPKSICLMVNLFLDEGKAFVRGMFPMKSWQF